MNTTARVSEVVQAHLLACTEGRWLDAHTLQQRLVDLEEGRPVYHCFRVGCTALLPADFADQVWCSAACAELYRLMAATPAVLRRSAADSADHDRDHARRLVAA